MQLNQGLFDNDIVIKLVACGLMSEVLDSFQIVELHTLSSFRYQLKPNKPGKLANQVRSLPATVQNKIIKFVDETCSIKQPIDNEFIDRCVTEHGLDEGEVLLLEAAIRLKKPLLLTADKRFLMQISKIPWLLDKLVTQLPGRFICLEVILLLMINEFGYDNILKKVSSSKDRFNEVKLVFGGSHDKTEANAREALSYELTRLSNAVGLLMYQI